jgi:hypothetical protein
MLAQKKWRPRPTLTDMLKVNVNGYVYLCDHGDFGDKLWVHETLPHFNEVVRKYTGQDCWKISEL